jgi:hypothetical protein
LIESRWTYYRPSSFPSFWTKLEEAVDNGFFISPTLVLDELKRKEDELYLWASKRKKMFVPLDFDLQNAQAEIINRFPKLINQAKNRSLCDPWVIALAGLKGCPVVTEERPGGINKPRIPDVCNQLGIECVSVADLIEQLNWKF